MRGQRHDPTVLYPGKDPVPIVREAGWVPGPVWTSAENLSPVGIRSPDCPARSQSIPTTLPGPRSRTGSLFQSSFPYAKKVHVHLNFLAVKLMLRISPLNILMDFVLVPDFKLSPYSEFCVLSSG